MSAATNERTQPCAVLRAAAAVQSRTETLLKASAKVVPGNEKLVNTKSASLK